MSEAPRSEQPSRNGHSEVLSLGPIAQELLSEARTASADRAARTITTGTSLRATLIALVAHAELAEHESPPAATLEVLTGEVRLDAGERHWTLSAGQWLPIPPFRHSLTALADSVVLLTVALH